MNAVDALVLLVLAFADIGLIVHLRRRRSRKLAMERMMGSLRLYVSGEVSRGSAGSPRRG
jgi:hypothetical protein